MSKSFDIFKDISFGTKFSEKKFPIITKLKNGKDSEISEFFGSKNKKTNFTPSKTLNFFNDKEFSQNQPIPTNKIQTITLPQQPNTTQFSNLDEKLTFAQLCSKYKIRISSTSVNIPPLVRSFDELKKNYGIRDYLIRNIMNEKFEKMMAVQMSGIPVLLSKIECLIAAPTGSGKTLTFIVPILSGLNKPYKKMKKKGNNVVRSVVIVPTNVLSTQITREFKKFGHSKQWIIKQLSKNAKKEAFERNIDILVSTPNRLVNFIRNKYVNLSQVEYLIMDEADRLFDMGFIEQLDEIVNSCSNPNVIRGLFSATIPLGVEHLAKTFLRSPIRITVGLKNTGAENITQELKYMSNEKGKFLALRNYVCSNSDISIKPPILIFANSIKRVEEIYKKIIFDNYHVDYITSKRNHKKITNIINQFRTGKIWVLISTDLMARGLDVMGISCVINYDFPRNEIEYIHRIGRTGRANVLGKAITFFTLKDQKKLSFVVKVMKRSKQNVPKWVDQLLVLKKRNFEEIEKNNQNVENEFESQSKKRKFK